MKSEELEAGVVTVYMAMDGGIHHAVQSAALAPREARGLELDFYCLACAESVTIPFCVLERIPVADGA